MSDYASWFGARLREALGDIPQTDLVALMKENGFEITTGRVSHYMQGRRYPDPPTLREMARALGVSADWLLGLTEESMPVADLEEVLARASGRSEIDRIMQQLTAEDRAQIMAFAQFKLNDAKQQKEEADLQYDIDGVEAALNVYYRRHGAEAGDDLIDMLAKLFPGLAALIGLRASSKRGEDSSQDAAAR